MSDTALPEIERPAFFDGQRLTAADLAQAQAYARDLRWLHNRSLHGWGIVAGLAADGDRGAKSVTVHAGYALDCAGRDLVLAEPVVLEVPAAAGPATYVLTISYAEDAALAAEDRDGVCGTRGAVRLVDAPLVRWQDPLTADPEGEIRPGLDLVLATASVAACKLAAPLAPGDRRELPRPSPYVAGGTTPVGATEWRLWPNAARAAGVTTTVDTSAAGFGGVPIYQARVGGERMSGDGPAWAPAPAAFDGPASVASPAATGFELRVLLPASTEHTPLHTGGGDGRDALLNPADMLDASLPERLRDELRWHVAWIGVEP